MKLFNTHHVGLFPKVLAWFARNKPRDKVPVTVLKTKTARPRRKTIAFLEMP